MPEDLPADANVAVAVLGERVANLMTVVEKNRQDARVEQDALRVMIREEFAGIRASVADIETTLKEHSAVLNAGKGGWKVLVGLGTVAGFVFTAASALLKYLGVLH